MKYAKILGLAFLMALLPLSAFAADKLPLGIYVGGKLGFSHYEMDSHKLKYEEKNWTYSDRSFRMSSFNTSSFAAGLVAGYNFDKRFDLPFRIDIEAVSRSGDDKTFRNSNTLQTSAGGAGAAFNTVYEMDIENVSSFMINGWFDFPVSDSPLKPYIGIGFGIISVSYDSDFYVQRGNQTMRKDVDGTDSAAAWSAGAGVAWDINSRFTLDLGYRYMDTLSKIEIELLDALDSKVTSKFHVNSHDLMLGLRVNF